MLQVALPPYSIAQEIPNVQEFSFLKMFVSPGPPAHVQGIGVRCCSTIIMWAIVLEHRNVHSWKLWGGLSYDGIFSCRPRLGADDEEPSDYAKVTIGDAESEKLKKKKARDKMKLTTTFLEFDKHK